MIPKWGSIRGLGVAILGVLLYGLTDPCWAVFQNGISEDMDALYLTTRYGSGIFIQSVEMSRHFSQGDEFSDNYFVKQQLAQEETLRPKIRIPDPLSWRLGFSYGNSLSPAGGGDSLISDNTFSALLGFHWQTNKAFSMGMRFNLDRIPEENYGHASGLFRIEVKIPLRSEKELLKSIDAPKTPEEAEEREMDESDYDPDSAFQYYRRLREEKAKRRLASRAAEPDYVDDPEVEQVGPQEPNDENHPIPQPSPFPEGVGVLAASPYLKLGVRLGLSYHLVQEKTFRRLSRGGASISDQTMNHYLAALDVTYVPHPTFSVQIAGSVNFYSAPVDNLNALIESDVLRKQSLVTLSGFSASENQLFYFPSVAFDQSVHWAINDLNALHFNFNETFYSSSLLNLTYAIGPSFSHYLGYSWEIGLESNLIMGGAGGLAWSAGLGLGYHLH